MIDLKPNHFPDELVLNKDKDNLSFGEQYAKAIWALEEAPLGRRQAQFKKNQLYADGKHPIDKCQERIAGKFIEKGFLKIDWESRLTFLPDQLHKAWNAVDFTEFSPVVYAIDPTAREIKKKRKNEKERLFAAKDFIKEMAQIQGQSPIPLDQIPQSKEQIEVEEETAPQLDIETAEELVLKGISEDNLFDEIQNITFRDATVKGLGVANVYTDPIEGIKIRYVRPDNFIFQATTDRFFRDCKYFAEVRELTVAEIRKVASTSSIVLTDQMIRDMFNDQSIMITDHLKVKVLLYTFQTFHKKITKSKKNRKTNVINNIDRTDTGYEPKSESDISKKVEDVYDVWYEGVLVLTTNKKIIRHKLVENLAEYKGKIFPPFIAYAPRMTENGLNSLVEQKIPSIDKLQELDMRIQHMRNELKGNITRINPETFSKVKLGKDFLKPEQVLSFYFTKYLAFDINMDEDGDPSATKTAITEVPSGIPYALRELASEFANEYNHFLRSFGYIGADDQKQDSKSLWESEPYRLSDNNLLKDYSDAAYKWSIHVLQNCSSRLNDAIEDKNLRDKYVAMIGTDDIEVIEKYRNDRINHYFGVYMDYVPTREERMVALQDIDMYVKNGLLTPADAMELRNTRNVKLATRILNLKIEARKKAEQENRMAEAEQMQNGNIQASNIAAENKIKTIQAEYDLKMRQAALDFENKFKLIQAQGETNLRIEALKSENKNEVEKYRKDMEAALAKYKKDRDEDIRIKGIKASAEEQSYLIDQRHGKVPRKGSEPQQPEVDLTQLNNEENYGNIQ